MFEKNYNETAGSVGGALMPRPGNGSGAYTTNGPVPPGSLSDAVARLNTAIEHNREIIAQTSGRLENIGVLRSSTPQVSGADSANPIREAALAQSLIGLASQLESNNARLTDICTRIDS